MMSRTFTDRPDASAEQEHLPFDCSFQQTTSLLLQGALPQLLLEIQMVFPQPALFTPLELQADYNGTWPSIDTLSAQGKKVLFVTGADYGEAIDSFMFSK